MKIQIITLIFICLSVFTIDARQGGPLGLGFVLGDPTGISVKYWTGKENAVSGVLAFNLSHRHYDHDGHYYYDDSSMDAYLHINYLWHSFQVFPVERGRLPIYWGVGGRLVMGNDFALGARGCGGVEFLPNAPIDIYLELGLVLNVVPYTAMDGDIGIGLRYFF